MKLAEFHIGLEFIEGPFWWRCTDVGSRSVVAIRLVEDDPVWYAGPPYMVEEVVLDEASLADCHLTEEGHIEVALIEADTSGHPDYPHEAMQLMADSRPPIRGRDCSGLTVCRRRERFCTRMRLARSARSG